MLRALGSFLVQAGGEPDYRARKWGALLEGPRGGSGQGGDARMAEGEVPPGKMIPVSDQVPLLHTFCFCDKMILLILRQDWPKVCLRTPQVMDKLRQVCNEWKVPLFEAAAAGQWCVAEGRSKSTTVPKQGGFHSKAQMKAWLFSEALCSTCS